MNFEQTFPLRYFINLGRRQDRRVGTEIALAEAGISAERLPAVDARFVKNPRAYESAGRYALALSQRLAIRRAMLKKADAVLIFEDDVVFHPGFLEKLAGIELPDDWGIFYLGCAHQRRPQPVGPGLVQTTYALDTHAFAVRAPYFREVMRALDPRPSGVPLHPKASDWYLADLHETIPTYACHPNLAWQTVGKSDLAGGTYSNYTATGEQIHGAANTAALQAELWGSIPWRSWEREELGESVAGVARSPAEQGFPTPRVWENPSVPVRRDPKLGLLFLTRGDVHHPGIWRDFADQSGGGTRVFSHAKDPGPAEAGFLAGSAIKERWTTEWGSISLVRAMMALLKSALADESLTHFVFLSESCVPLRPWSEVRRRLRIDPRTMMENQPAEAMQQKHFNRFSKIEDLPVRAWRKHDQWVLLDREAAVCVTEVDFTDRFAGMFAPDEHYIGSVLALRGYPQERINRQPVTWCQWQDSGRPGGPREFSEVPGDLPMKLAAFPGFFARKFPANTRIGEWGLHLEDSMNETAG